MTAPADMTDAEIDAAVAWEVMGWESHGDFLLAGHSSRLWRPSTDIAAAFEVVERMREKQLLTMFSTHLCDILEVEPEERYVAVGYLFERLTPRAICEAALAAVRARR